MVNQSPRASQKLNRNTQVAILGAGSWGTAIAIHLARREIDVQLWGYNPEHIKTMQKQRCNPFYLPDAPFPDKLIPQADLTACLQGCQIVIVAVPSHAFQDLLVQLSPDLTSLSWLTKGLDSQTNCLLSDLVSAKYGRNFPQAIISGPSFATEVAHCLPTALTVASNSIALQTELIQLLHDNTLRVYASKDMIGVQIAGAIKNVLAIACGISDGLGYGANA